MATMDTTLTRSPAKIAVQFALTSIFISGVLIGPARAQDENKNKSFPVKVRRDNYPAPEYRYPNAQIGLNAKDSKPDFPPAKRAPQGAPNILLVLIDDVGFGCASTFGGMIETPTLDRLAANGLRYNAFHTTALCS